MPAAVADPAEFPHALRIEACDIPAGMTIAEWRARRRATPRPAPRRRRWLGRRRFTPS
jgi:hypothetical protein